LKRKIKRLGSKSHVPGARSKVVGINLKAVCGIDYECTGCPGVSKSCCAKYNVCVDEAEMRRIIPVLPEAAKLCPHLKTQVGYANVFEEEEKGYYSLDTHENGLCVFAYRAANGLIRCSLHTVEEKLGLPLGSVKPAVCILWPLTFSDGGDLTVHDDALSCVCSTPRAKPSRQVSPALLEIIRHFGWETSYKGVTKFQFGSIRLKNSLKIHLWPEDSSVRIGF
jgi:hypothetical protein